MPKHKYHIDVENLLWLPGEYCVFWKDCHGHYLGCNDVAAEKTNLKSREDVVGRTDYDIETLFPEEARRIQDGDKRIIAEKKPLYFLNSATNSVNKNVFITFKAPLWNQKNEVVGIYGVDTFINLQDEKSYNHLIKKAGTSMREINLLISKSDFGKDITHYHGLTKRQADCLFYLVIGMTMREIAIQLSLSSKTVEHYLNNVKKKLNCRARSQLINKALKIPYIKNKLNSSSLE